MCTAAFAALKNRYINARPIVNTLEIKKLNRHIKSLDQRTFIIILYRNIQQTPSSLGKAVFLKSESERHKIMHFLYILNPPSENIYKIYYTYYKYIYIYCQEKTDYFFHYFAFTDLRCRDNVYSTLEDPVLCQIQ